MLQYNHIHFAKTDAPSTIASSNQEKEEVDVELSEASLSPYMATDYSDSSGDEGTVEVEDRSTEEECEPPGRDPRESITLLRNLYNEANYGAHHASLGIKALRGEGYKNRVHSLASPYIKRHKPTLSVKKKKPSKVGQRLLTHTPVKRGQTFKNPRSLKPSSKKNFIKENIESVKKGTRTGGGNKGKTRVVYDVEHEGCVYRVLPSHVKSTPNSRVLSVNIEEDLWVDVPRNAG